MKLCTRKRVIELINEGKILIKGVDDIENAFLDDIRLGLSLRDELLEIYGPIDLTQIESIPYRKIRIGDSSLKPGKLYVGLSKEKMCLANNVMGFINTRSRYTRIGLEMARSSVFIIPGFGSGVPTPITFEISVQVEIKNLVPYEKYAYVIIYELNEGIEALRGRYWDRFPLKYFEDKK